MKIVVVKSFLLIVLSLMVLSCKPSAPVSVPDSSNPSASRAERANNKALALMNSKHYEAAKLYFEKAIEEFRKTKKSRLNLLNCYINLGNCYLELKNSAESENYLDKAMKLALTIKDYKDFRLAQSFKQLAKSYYMKRNFQAAINNYEAVLQIVNRLYGKDHKETARIYNILSQIYFNIGDKQTAQIYNEKSLSIKLRGRIRKKKLEKNNTNLESYTEAYGVVHDKVAIIYHKKGLVELFKGNYDEALQMFHKAISIYFSLDKENNSAIAELYLDTAKCYYAKNNPTEASHYLKLIKNLLKSRRGFIFKRKAEVEYRLGLIALNQSAYFDALNYLQSALQLSSKNFRSNDMTQNPLVSDLITDNIVLNILFTKADILRQIHMQVNNLKYLKASNKTFQLIIELMYKIRNKDKSSSYRHIFNTRCTPIYKRAIFTALKLYKQTKDKTFLKDALIYTEAGKAAILSDMIFEAGTPGKSMLPDDLRKKERDLYYKLNTFNMFLSRKKLRKASEKGQHARIVKFRKMYHSLLLEHTALVNFLDIQYPDSTSKQINISLPDVNKLMHNTDKDSAILEYYLIGRRLVIYIITKNDINIHTERLKYNIKETVQKFCNSIRKINEADYKDLAHKLGSTLITPLNKWIINKKKLIIIPHGTLFKIPFEALLLKQNSTSNFAKLDYLIKEFSVQYNYSAQLWADKRSIDIENLSFTGFAPVFKGGRNLNTVLHLRNNIPENFPELPNSEKEVREIIQLFKTKGRKAEGFFNSDATEKTFIQNTSCGNNQIIHIASHSITNPGSPLFSGILFNSPGTNTEADNILYSAEIFNLKLNPALLVLSSCDSGAGKLIENEGMAGINRAFIYSGARNVVFSFWKVDDKSTSEIMIEFYKSLLNATSFTESLREAKLKMIQNEYTSFPKYWSSFVIISGS